MSRERQLKQAEESGALVTYEPMKIDESWGVSIPVSQFQTTHDVNSESGKKAIYKALNDDGKSAKDCVNMPLTVVGVTFTPQTKITPDGEHVGKIATKLSLKDGSIVGTNSEWLARSVLSLMQFRGCNPSPERPWRLEIRAKNSGVAPDGSQKTCLKIYDLDY